jgi:serine/threonine protein kinase
MSLDAGTRLGPAPLTDVGVVMGTMPYMAPEQVQGHDVDARADLFAFGAILYEMVTGERAFAADSQAGLIAALLDQHGIAGCAPAESASRRRHTRTGSRDSPINRPQSRLVWLSSAVATGRPHPDAG